MANAVMTLSYAIDKGMIEIEKKHSTYPKDSSSLVTAGEESSVFTGESSTLDSKTSRGTYSSRGTDSEDWPGNIDTQRFYNPFQLPSISETEEEIQDTDLERPTSEATTNIASNVAGRRHTSSCPPNFDVFGSFVHSEGKTMQNVILDREHTVAMAECAEDDAVQDPFGAWPSEIGVWGVPAPEHDIIAEDLGSPNCRNHIHLLEESFQEN